jgi:release factor glutamine methyltransferase
MDIRNNLLVYLREKYISELKALYEENEARQLLTILIHDFFGFSRAGLVLNPDLRLSESEILQLHFAVKDLKSYKPIQYITGKSEFLGLTFQVNESVLIPRPETEELVQLIISKEKKKNLNVLDVGTGSGCIAISLEKKLISPKVCAIDVDENALNTASANATQNSSTVKFIKVDMLDENSWNEIGVFDIIVSNPPYATINDKTFMQENILNYEPHLALFVPENDEIVFYKKICRFAQEHLVAKGRIYFEINENKAPEIENLLNQKGFKTIEIHKDFRGKWRFASAIKF